MNPILRNVLSVIAGWIVGSITNMSTIKIGHNLLPLEGIDPNDMAALAAAMPGMDAKHFISIFLAHALGTLAGAYVAARIAATHKLKMGLIVGILFLIGGITLSFMLPAPTWFDITDIVLAYIPMAYLGAYLAR